VIIEKISRNGEHGKKKAVAEDERGEKSRSEVADPRLKASEGKRSQGDINWKEVCFREAMIGKRATKKKSPDWEGVSIKQDWGIKKRCRRGEAGDHSVSQAERPNDQ